MILIINIDHESFELEVPEQILKEGEGFFQQMDEDFDRGWQMGRFWVDNPSVEERCQVAANKIVDAMHREDKRMFYLMSAYILKSMPEAKEITVKTEEEIQDIDIRV